MDGIHDLGGKKGYGAIDVDEPEQPFHHQLDGIGWSINQTTRAPGLMIDWWRHIRELTPDEDYLNRPYFDQWAMTQLLALIDNDQITLDEVLKGPVIPVAEPAQTMSIEQVYRANLNAAIRYDREVQHPAKYKVGDVIKTRDYHVQEHCRLPDYAQDKKGVVSAHHGAHLFPDECAKGNEVAEHLYTVKFSAYELWPNEQGDNTFIYLDLWEPYFVD